MVEPSEPPAGTQVWRRGKPALYSAVPRPGASSKPLAAGSTEDRLGAVLVSGDRMTSMAAGTAGYGADSDLHRPVDDILLGLSSIGPPEVMQKLAALHAEVADDRTLLAILVAAEEMATRWRQEHDQVDQHWLAYEKALAAESDARRTLDMLLRTVARLAESSRPARIASDRTDSDRSVVTPVDSAGGDGPIRGGMAAGVCPPVTTGSVDLAVCLLGRFRLFRRGQLVESWQGSKTPRVVRYLFAQRGGPAPRDVLIDLFWPDVDPETARRNLHQAIYVIRKALRAALIRTSSSSLPTKRTH